MRHIGLFEGIGGFSLAARWMGWETVAWCEWDTFCQRILKHHFPEAEQHGDITTTGFTRYAGKIDILTGGFPCQPYSSAGKRLGKEDDRHLWPEMLRAVREIQPRWIVGENVRGLTNWNGGMVFDEVQADLENEGYEVTPYLLPACAVNAPHRRDRIWFIAHAKGGNDRRAERELCQENGGQVRGMLSAPCSASCRNGEQWTTANANRDGHKLRGFGEDRRPSIAGKSKQEKRERIWSYDRGVSESGDATNPNEKRLERTAENGHMGGEQRFVQRISGWQWEDFPTQPPICSRNDGISSKLDGITFPKWREKSIGAYGNAIVPQVALQIFKAIQQYEK